MTTGRLGERELLGIERPSPEEEAAEERRLADAAEVRKAWLIGQMQNHMFREWLMEILVGFGTFSTMFGAGPSGFPDPLATQFQMGRKAAGWELWTTFDDVSPELASVMRREYSSRGS